MSDTATAPDTKSQGQQALERLLMVRTRYAKASQELKAAIAGIGGPKAPASFAQAPVGAEGGHKDATQFFPALKAITDELDREAVAIEASIAELARHF